MIKKLILVLLIILIPTLINAGVTIDYSGSVSSEIKQNEVIDIAKIYARNHNWAIKNIKNGIILLPADWCDPIKLEFNGKNLVEDFVKTQFAGAEIHADVIGLFKVIKSKFIKLDIYDEGEYWETGDYNKLTENIETANKMIKQFKSQNPKATGPIKLPCGRIMDLKE